MAEGVKPSDVLAFVKQRRNFATGLGVEDTKELVAMIEALGKAPAEAAPAATETATKASPKKKK